MFHYVYPSCYRRGRSFQLSESWVKKGSSLYTLLSVSYSNTKYTKAMMIHQNNSSHSMSRRLVRNMEGWKLSSCLWLYPLRLVWMQGYVLILSFSFMHSFMENRSMPVSNFLGILWSNVRVKYERLLTLWPKRLMLIYVNGEKHVYHCKN